MPGAGKHEKMQTRIRFYKASSCNIISQPCRLDLLGHSAVPLRRPKKNEASEHPAGFLLDTVIGTSGLLVETRSSGSEESGSKRAHG